MTDFTVRRFGRYSREELIAKLRAFLTSHESSYVAGHAFSSAAGVSQGTIERAFGSWASFCRAAGVQPRAKEMKQPEAPISLSRYTKILCKPWHEIREDVLLWKAGVIAIEGGDSSEARARPRQRSFRPAESYRSVPLSVRYSVQKRDDFRCVRCGRSPATDRAVQLHVDHVVPRSKGGSGELGNLQTLCSDCNLGKSDRHKVQQQGMQTALGDREAPLVIH